MKTTPIDRLSLDSKEIDERIRANVPFITHVTWPAHSTWNLDYLKRKLLPKQVRIFRRVEGGGLEPQPMDIAAYLDLVARSGYQDEFELGGSYDFRLWLRGTPDPHFGVLLDDLTLPPFVRMERLLNITFWYASGRGETLNHYDPNGMHNVNFQITGRKRFRLFAPDRAGTLGLVPALDRLEPPLWSNESLDPKDCVGRPGYDELPCLDGWLEPGDAIFVPAFYMHWVSYDPSPVVHCNVNCWFAPEPGTVVLSSIPASWAYVNAVIVALRRRLGNVPIRDLCEAIRGMNPETRQLLRDIEEILLYQPEVLEGRFATELRLNEVAPPP